MLRSVRDLQTDLGGPRGDFPSTCWSLIVGARDPGHPQHRERLDRLIRDYWKPVYLTILHGWKRTNEEAKDIAQDFFLGVIENQWLDGFAPDRGSFRKYVQGALKHFMLNERRYREARKRGSGQAPVAIEAVAEPPMGGATPEEALEREWARSVLEHAMERLRVAEPKIDVDCFRDFHVSGEGVSYAELSKRHGVPEPDLGTRLHRMRRRFRECVEEVVREYVAGPAECAEEIARLSTILGGR